MNEAIDILAVGAHPDDVECGAAGTLILAKKAGLRIGMIVLTRGERGNYGTLLERIQEAQAGAQLLGVDSFELLDYPDGFLAATHENALRLAHYLKEWRPRLVLCPHADDRHPDHVAAARLVDQALYFAARTTILPELPALPRPQLWRYPLDQARRVFPTIVVDISSVWTEKQAALRAHASQYATNLAPVEIAAQYLGSTIGALAGEGFVPDGPVVLREGLSLLEPAGG